MYGIGRVGEKRYGEGIEKGMKTGKVLARYEDGMSPEEIARKMGLTVEQVEKILEENGMLTTV